MTRLRLAGTATAIALAAAVATTAVVAQQAQSPGRSAPPAGPTMSGPSQTDESYDDLQAFLDLAEDDGAPRPGARGGGDMTGQGGDMPGEWRGRGGWRDDDDRRGPRRQPGPPHGMMGPDGMMGRGGMMGGPGMGGPGMMGSRGMMERDGMMGGPDMMGRHGMMGGPGRMGLCGPRGERMAEMMLMRLERVTRPTEAQRGGLEKLREAAGKAHEIARAGCPAEPSFTPTGRLANAEKRLEAMLQAVRTVRPAFEEFFASLNDEQKARLYAATSRRSGPMMRGRGDREGWQGPHRGPGERQHWRDGRGGDGRGDGWPGGWRGRS